MLRFSRSGLLPITTCSPRNFEHVKSLGAVEAFDYHSPSCGNDIKEYTKDSLQFALDCITDTPSIKLCEAAIASSGGNYCGLDPIPVRGHFRRSVKLDWIVAFTMSGEPVNWVRPFMRDERPKDRAFSERFYAIAQGLLDQGKIVPHAFQEASGGLKGIAKGLDQIRFGKVAGFKLVYSVA